MYVDVGIRLSMFLTKYSQENSPCNENSNDDNL